MTHFTCSTNYTWPILDIIAGVPSLAGGIGVVWLVSAWSGFSKASKCSEAKRASDRAFYQFLQTPEGLRADVSIDRVVISATAGAIDSLRVGMSTQLRAAALNKAGVEIAERQFLWTTSDSTLAVVGPTGVVTARSQGVVHISASTGGISGSFDQVVIP